MKAEVGQVFVSCGATVQPAPIAAAKAELGEVIVTTEITLHRGRVKSFSPVNGYGFLLTGGGDLFFHKSSLEEGYRPTKGDRVTFQIAGSRRQRLYATNVRRIES